MLNKIKIIISSIFIIFTIAAIYVSDKSWEKIINPFTLATFGLLFCLANLRYSEKFKCCLLTILQHGSKFIKNIKLQNLFLAASLGSIPIKNRAILAAAALPRVESKRNEYSALAFLASHFYYFVVPYSPALISFLLLTGYSMSAVLPYLAIPAIILLICSYKLAPEDSINIKITQEKLNFRDFVWFASIFAALIAGLFFKSTICLLATIILLIIFRDYKLQLDADIFLTLSMLALALAVGPILKEIIRTNALIFGNIYLAAFGIGFLTGSSKTSVSIIYSLFDYNFKSAIIAYPLWWAGYMLSPLHACPLLTSAAVGGDNIVMRKYSIIIVGITTIISIMIYSFIF